MRQVSLAVAGGDKWTINDFTRRNGYKSMNLAGLREAEARDDEGELNNIYRFYKDNVRYTGDITGVDTYTLARRTLFEMHGGDCDDALVAIGTMLGHNGFGVIARCIAQKGVRDLRGGPIVGHIYCPVPETRVLTLDLRWVAAGDLHEGQQLIAFDEIPRAPGGRRDLSPSHVVAVRREKRACLRLHLSDGTALTAAHDHGWLVKTKMGRSKNGGGDAPLQWRSSAQISAYLDKLRRIRRNGNLFMPRFFRVWTGGNSYAAGWTAGVYDGEGSLVVRDRKRLSHRSSYVLNVSQNPGLVLDLIYSRLREDGFGFSVGNRAPPSRCISIDISGGISEIFRALGYYRPARLLEKFMRLTVACRRLPELRCVHTPEIVSAENVGERDVVVLQTSTSTYFAEGFGSHNCVALTPKFTPQAGIALDATLALGNLGSEVEADRVIDYRLF